jgi:hypothetical protein
MTAILVIYPDKILFVIGNIFKVLLPFFGCACLQPEREMCPWAISKCFGDLVSNTSA